MKCKREIELALRIVITHLILTLVLKLKLVLMPKLMKLKRKLCITSTEY